MNTPAGENAAVKVTKEIYANTSSRSGQGGPLQRSEEGTDGTPTLANRVQSLISSVFTFAMDADLAEANPCHRLRKRGVERVGRRVLSEEEIRLFWSRIVEPPATRRTGLALRLTLLTGARISEIAGISRAELERLGDASRAAWIIPGTRTKNGRDHLVPLSPLAQDLVHSAGNEELRPSVGRRHTGSPNLAC
jgi:integrase